MDLNIKQLGEQLNAKRTEAAEFMTSHKNDAGGYKMTPTDIDTLKAKRAEIDDLAKKYNDALDTAKFEHENAEAIKSAKEPTNDLPGVNGKQRGSKSLGQFVTDSNEFKGINPHAKSGSITLDLKEFNFKTLMSTTAGFAAPNDRTDIVIMSAQRNPVVSDLLPIGNTDLSSIRYMEETTATNNAAARSEGGTYAESAIAFTERSVPVESISHAIPVTDEQLSDVPQVLGIINDRLTLFLQQKFESELLNGNGSSPRIQGFLNKAGIQTQAKGADPVFDTILKTFTKVSISGGSGSDTYGSAAVSGLIMNPIDWQNLVLTRTVDGLYILGNPGNTTGMTVWGVQPTITGAIAQGTALAGDFRKYSQAWLRQGITIEVGYVNDDFVKGKKTIRASMRGALVIYRAGAFVTATGL